MGIICERGYSKGKGYKKKCEAMKLLNSVMNSGVAGMMKKGRRLRKMREVI